MAQSTQDLDRLKQKYQSVLNLMQQLQVQLQNVNMQGSQLFIRGIAPSAEAKNKIWDQVKLVDPTYSDLTLNLTVDPSLAPKEQVYTVAAGDSLSKIAKQFYGNANEYMKIFNANRDKLNDPNTIKPGQQLVIPS